VARSPELKQTHAFSCRSFQDFIYQLDVLSFKFLIKSFIIRKMAHAPFLVFLDKIVVPYVEKF
jgi:hypothetical protein